MTRWRQSGTVLSSDDSWAPHEIVVATTGERLEARPSDEWFTWVDNGRIVQMGCSAYGCGCSGDGGLRIHQAHWCGEVRQKRQAEKRAT